jgi:hypothetical protein
VPLTKPAKSGKQAGGVKFGIDVQAGEDMGYVEDQEQGELYYEEGQADGYGDDGYGNGHGYAGMQNDGYGSAGMQNMLLGGAPKKPSGERRCRC